MKPFDLEEAKKGAPVCTRDGSSVRIICFDVKDPNFPIVALIYSPTLNLEHVATYRLSGCFVEGAAHQYDLFMVEEEHEEHYDISNFKPFDRVLTRDGDCRVWRANIYSHINKNPSYLFSTIDSDYKQCIPYNEETAHLIGTSDMPPKKYINW